MTLSGDVFPVQGSSKEVLKRRDVILKRVEAVATREGIDPNHILSLVEYIVGEYSTSESFNT